MTALYLILFVVWLLLVCAALRQFSVPEIDYTNPYDEDALGDLPAVPQEHPRHD